MRSNVSTNPQQHIQTLIRAIMMSIPSPTPPIRNPNSKIDNKNIGHCTVTHMISSWVTQWKYEVRYVKWNVGHFAIIPHLTVAIV